METHSAILFKVNRYWKSKRHLRNVKISFISNYNQDQVIHHLKHQIILVVIPSLAENFSGSVFKCIPVGIPFIASDVGGIAEMIHADDKNETLFRPIPKSLVEMTVLVLDEDGIVISGSRI